MKKVIKLTETDLTNLVSRVLKEHEQSNYMFFSNLEQIIEQCQELLDMDPSAIDELLSKGHDWADDHMTEAKTNINQVFNFIKKEVDKNEDYIDYDMVNEAKKNKPTNPKLWQASLSWAKGRYKVCPSAFCNGAAAKRYKSKGGKWKKESK